MPIYARHRSPVLSLEKQDALPVAVQADGLAQPTQGTADMILNAWLLGAGVAWPPVIRGSSNGSKLHNFIWERSSSLYCMLPMKNSQIKVLRLHLPALPRSIRAERL